MNVCVIGIGAMGGGIARGLLESNRTKHVVGYDRNANLVAAYQKDAVAANKMALEEPPACLHDAIVKVDTQVIFLVLVNEAQCDEVCFGSSDQNVLECLKSCSGPACVILCSTVTATWARKACDEFKRSGIHFVDCPISGGPVRARARELTMMASGDEESLSMAMPLLKAVGKEIHVIEGGAGMGSTVKVGLFVDLSSRGIIDHELSMLLLTEV